MKPVVRNALQHAWMSRVVDPHRPGAFTERTWRIPSELSVAVVQVLDSRDSTMQASISASVGRGPAFTRGGDVEHPLAVRDLGRGRLRAPDREVGAGGDALPDAAVALRRRHLVRRRRDRRDLLRDVELRADERDPAAVVSPPGRARARTRPGSSSPATPSAARCARAGSAIARSSKVSVIASPLLATCTSRHQTRVDLDVDHGREQPGAQQRPVVVVGDERQGGGALHRRLERAVGQPVGDVDGALRQLAVDDVEDDGADVDVAACASALTAAGSPGRR